MDRSQLPMLKKKKAHGKDVATMGDNDIEAAKKQKSKSFQMKHVATELCKGYHTTMKDQQSRNSSLRMDDDDANNAGQNGVDLKKQMTVDHFPTVNGDRVASNGSTVRRERTGLDKEWSKYIMRSPRSTDQTDQIMTRREKRFEDISFGKAKQTIKTKQHFSQLPHPVRQCYSSKLDSPHEIPSLMEGHDDVATNDRQRINNIQVFNFDTKQFDDPDTSPIYHELDPLDTYDQPVQHTYQSITEIREEIDKLQNATIPGVSTSKTKMVAWVKNTSSSVPNSPTLVAGLNGSSNSSPGTQIGHQGSPKSQSIFSKLWLQRKSSHISKASSGNEAKRDAVTVSDRCKTSATCESICADVSDVENREGNSCRFSPSLYLPMSPPPASCFTFADFYQSLGSNCYGDVQAVHSVSSPSTSFGSNTRQSHLFNCNVSSLGNTKRSFSESSATPFHGNTNKPRISTKTNIAYESRLSWRNRDEMSVNEKFYANRWDLARCGEPPDGHIPPAGTHGLANLETFRSFAGKSSLLDKQNKTVAKSSSSNCPVRTEVPSVSPLSIKKTALMRKQIQKMPKAPEALNGRAREIQSLSDRLFPTSETITNLSSFSGSQENVINASFPLEFLSSSRPGSFESLLSEDDVFLPGSNERINVVSPPLRSTFSSPSCGVRMAELRAVRRKSDSKSPSPEPLASTPPPPPTLPIFQIAMHHSSDNGPVSKHDVSVQTSPVKSPVRLGGKVSHRYMHTIIEEDHCEQGFGIDVKLNGSNSTELKNMNTAHAAQSEGERRYEEADAFIYDLSINGKHEMDDSDRKNAKSGDSLEIISCADDNSSSDKSSGKIKLSNISCSTGNDQTTTVATTTITTDIRMPTSPQPVNTLNELSSISDEQSSMRSCSSMDSDKVNEEEEEDSQSTTSAALSESQSSAASSSLSAHCSADSELRTKHPTNVREKIRAKGSKLRLPKHAKFIVTSPSKVSDSQNGANRVTPVDHYKEDAVELHHYSSQRVKPRANNVRPFVAPKQFNDTLRPDIAVDVASRIQPIIKQASVRCIESFGTSNPGLAGCKDKELIISSDQQAAAERLCSASLVPLKTSRCITQQHKNPVQVRNKCSADPKNNLSHSKSQHCIMSSASGSRDRMDTVPCVSPCGATSLPSSGHHGLEMNLDYPVKSRTMVAVSSQYYLPKNDLLVAGRTSSLSSSLTSSSSSSLFSMADSESESSIITQSRKDPFLSIGRPCGTKSPIASDLVVTVTENSSINSSVRGVYKPAVEGGGKIIEKSSRLAVPKVNVSRCRERFEKFQNGKKKDIQTKQTSLMHENFCDDDKKEFLSTASSK